MRSMTTKKGKTLNGDVQQRQNPAYFWKDFKPIKKNESYLLKQQELPDKMKFRSTDGEKIFNNANQSKWRSEKKIKEQVFKQKNAPYRKQRKEYNHILYAFFGGGEEGQH